MIIDVQFRYLKNIQTIDSVQPAPIAIILGASVQSNGEPSDALRDRLLVGKELYEHKLVEKLLISGDDGRYHIDEIQIMRNFLEKNGVPSENVLEDGHGYRTYESCKRAVTVYNIHEAIVVTQRFHIGRALYLCNRLGMNSVGVASDLSSYQRIAFFTIRDLAASLEAWWDINVMTPKPPVEYTE
jgi:vancomycin permeability regulator SanA